MSCYQPGVFTPTWAPTTDQVENRANVANTTFDNNGYNNMLLCCKGKQLQLPQWPPIGPSRLFPRRDETQEMFPLRGNVGNINEYQDILTLQRFENFPFSPPNPFLESNSHCEEQIPTQELLSSFPYTSSLQSVPSFSPSSVPSSSDSSFPSSSASSIPSSSASSVPSSSTQEPDTPDDKGSSINLLLMILGTIFIVLLISMIVFLACKKKTR